MTENNQCFLDIDIHVMSWNMLLLYFIVASQIRQPTVPLFINLSQSDYVSLKLKNFHTRELYEHMETKFIFLTPCLFNTVLLPHLWRALSFLARLK